MGSYGWLSIPSSGASSNRAQKQSPIILGKASSQQKQWKMEIKAVCNVAEDNSSIRCENVMVYYLSSNGRHQELHAGLTTDSMFVIRSFYRGHPR